MDVLERRLSYDEVTEIFVRVNSLGAKLRSSDLALAQITAKWRGSLKIFQGFQSVYAKIGLDRDLGLHLKNLRLKEGLCDRLEVGGVEEKRCRCHAQSIETVRTLTQPRLWMRGRRTWRHRAGCRTKFFRVGVLGLFLAIVPGRRPGEGLVARVHSTLRIANCRFPTS